MRFSLFLAFKYLKPRRSVSSVITCVSIIGVMLGVAAVIVVRTVMTGFGEIWQEKILEFKPHVTIQSAAPGGLLQDEEALAARLDKIPGVASASPQVDTIALLKANGRVSAPILLGVDPDRFRGAYPIGEPVAGVFDLDSNDDAIILGIDMARSLGVYVGDDVKVFSPMLDENQFFLPVKWRVIGLFSTGQRDYDSHFAIARLDRVQDIMGFEDGVLEINVRTKDPANHAAFTATVKEIKGALPYVHLSTWHEDNADIFTALAVEQNMTTLLLALITVVAVFCVMNTLLVLGVQKTPEIGLLKSLGFSNGKIMAVFVIHGLSQCAIGCLLGIGAALAILANLQNIVDFIGMLGVEVFPKEIYGLDQIPHRVVPSAIVLPVAMAFLSALAASLVPATVAAAKNPVDALRK